MKRAISILIIGILVGVLLVGCTQTNQQIQQNQTQNQQNIKYPVIENFTTFNSADEMKEYLQKTYSSQFWLGFGFEAGVVRGEVVLDVAQPMQKSIPSAPTLYEKSAPERVSETNVQVKGIDEPDIVKTDGVNIYVSQTYLYPYWRWEKVNEGETKIIKAFPPEDLEVKYEISKGGQLLFVNKTLIVLNHDTIYGYDVSNKPIKKWNVELNGSLVTARLYNEKIYLVTRNLMDYYEPCPIKPLTYNGKQLQITCSQIYHPIYPVPVDVTYNVVVLDPQTGNVTKAVSFVGSSGLSVVYMSKNAIYITFPCREDVVKIYYNFMKENKDLFPPKIIEKVEKLKGYDISNRAKYVELQVIIDQYANSLSKDERLKFRNEFWNRISKYYEEHKREIERTGIVKVSLDLDVTANGKVPGRVLNQFSLDEYKGYLRIATTVGMADTTNDLYVLDGKLNIIGSLKDYGKGERIYAVRFVMDKAYVVTFKQTDPLFVMDLSDPKNPEMRGELEIPGYSSYLHPIDENTIIGIGKEGRSVKISLFDVSNPEKPIEIDKYLLDEYWSDILSTHHAFLIDKKHEIFFLPASKGGYVFSYKDDGLRLVKAVSVSALRAIYLDDYLYIIGDKIAVFDENTWEKVNEMDLS
ncbi:hypothetical protein DRP05_14465 [Archaeoglobales archaeon]|nr:MAG: hypothetical protein DRP05_14465 [Archaeoglobales archaeon]